MKYGANIYFNENVRSSFVYGYREGDPLQLSTVVIFPEADSPEAAASFVFGYLNMDERLNGKTERSLSVGDVVKIIVPDYEHERIDEIWLACEHIGWRQIENPLLGRG